MKIKKKMVEVKEKIRKWCDYYRDEIIAGSIVGIGMIGLTGVGYLVGKSDGKIDGYADGMLDYERTLFESFGIDSKSGRLHSIDNVETGFRDAIMAKEFYDIILSQPTIVKYDDGSWEFKNEIKK